MNTNVTAGRFFRTSCLLAALGLGPMISHAVVFSNLDGITINDATITGPSAANPYPSEVTVSGMGTQLTGISVTLYNYAHNYSPDIAILLQGPTGQNVMLMAEAGDTGDSVPTFITFTDSALQTPLSNVSLAEGEYTPVDYSTGLTWPDAGPSHTTPTSWTTTLSSFNNTNPNGTWKLFIQDFALGDSGSVGGWSVNITAVPEPEMSAAAGAVVLVGVALVRRQLRRR